MNTLPVLYSFRRCPYAMRARLAIAVSGHACELREIVLRDKPPSLLAASPKGTVPVLIDSDGCVIDQSLDIMLWALSRNDPAGWLAPGRGDLPAGLALIKRCDDEFKPLLDRYKYPQRFGLGTGLAHRDEAGLWLQELDKSLQASPFLFGNSPSLADMAIAPFIRQFAHTDKAWFQAQAWPCLQAWLDAWMNSPLFEQVMKKYSPWREGTQGERFGDGGQTPCGV
ncbi:glutathione S-transferase [Parapusillimonas sp. JC17]|uniref:glutathione S-transferase n=1 Tax=Parapusillimonas sp. JC17 TaxID=3445768 RepID=UPI003FA08817